MSDRILDDDCGYALGIGERQPKSDRAAVVVHIKCILFQTQSLHKFIDDLRNILERVSEFVWRRRVGMTEPGVIRSH